MSEKDEKGFCPILVAARIIVAGLNPEMKEINIKMEGEDVLAGFCLGKQCKIYSRHTPGCGLRNK